MTIHKSQGQTQSEDGISNVGRRSRVSRSSHASKTSRSSHTSSVSARAKAAARKAVLEAEAATLKMLHEIEEEELKLRQRKNELKLKTELAKARAEEHAYAQVEIGAKSPHASDQNKKLPVTPQLTEENLENKVEGQNEPKEEKPEPAFVEKLLIQTKALNPEASSTSQTSLKKSQESPTIPSLAKCKATKSRSIKRATGNNKKKDAKSFAAQGQGQSQQQKQLSNSEERMELKCPSCQKDHWLSHCNEFKKLSLYNRYQFVSKHLCINCLIPGHFVQTEPFAVSKDVQRSILQSFTGNNHRQN